MPGRTLTPTMARLIELRGAARGALEAYQRFLDEDDLEALRSGLTDLQQALECWAYDPDTGRTCNQDKGHGGGHRQTETDGSYSTWPS